MVLCCGVVCGVVCCVVCRVWCGVWRVVVWRCGGVACGVWHVACFVVVVASEVGHVSLSFQLVTGASLCVCMCLCVDLLDKVMLCNASHACVCFGIRTQVAWLVIV